MNDSIAIFLDLDNLVIGAQEANLPFEITPVLDYIEKSIGGRIILRRSYGDWRQDQAISRILANAGFELQGMVRINQSDKNLADIQMVVDAAETLIDKGGYETYVLITGDRDFVPLVQLLQRKGKYVIGLGLRHSTSNSLADLCDQYIFYDDLLTENKEAQVEEMANWVQKAAEDAFSTRNRVQASLFRDMLQAVSEGNFAQSRQSKMSLSKLLEQFPQYLSLDRQGTTLFVCPPGQPTHDDRDLRSKYRSVLKKQGLRVVPAPVRLTVLKDIVTYLELKQSVSRTPMLVQWRDLQTHLEGCYQASNIAISRSLINDVLRVARRAEVLTLPPRSSQPLTVMPVSLGIQGNQLFQDAVIKCDLTYLTQLETQFDHIDLEEASYALYDSNERITYFDFILKNRPNSPPPDLSQNGR